nr:uncharacterized protein LOC128704893 [Cherax quadricarinatus]
MRAKGITGKVGRWIYNFLTNRTQRVVVNRVKSEAATVKSSVPQGTVFAPILFLILISDIDKDVSHSTVSSFADDTRICMTVSSIADTARLQADINQIFQWAAENNMKFNDEKFQLLRYGKHEEIKSSSEYKTNSGHKIERNTNVKDLGVIMSEDLTFKDHNIVSIASARKMTGWIMRTFKTREAKPMMTLFRSLVLSRLEYCCTLTAPFKAGEIADLENVQRTFMPRITEIKHLNYWERLRFLNLYSLERRRERYMIIYTWKILEGLVPNLHTKITHYESKRLGRRCTIPPMKSRGVTSTLRDHTISVRGPRLFNCLPAPIRGITNRPLAVFKLALDKHLKSVPDQPGCGSYVGLRAASSNSLVDQALIHQEAWSQTGPRGR